MLVTGDVLTVTSTGSITAGPAAVSATGGGPTATSITNEAGGTISGSSTGIIISSSSSVGSITNSGTISGNSYGIHLNTSSAAGAITNEVGGAITGVNNTGIYLQNSSVVDSITNSGTISGNNRGIYLTSSSVTGAITNEAGGTISGSSTGIRLNSGSSVGSITNSGLIGSSSGSYGIHLNTSSSVTGAIINEVSGTITGVNNIGIYLQNSSVVDSITNSGTISGSGSGSSSGIGISLASGSSVTGAITNNGTISGNSTGIRLTNGSSVGSITNNSGTISGNNRGIYLTSSSVTGAITNEAGGTISGASSNGILLSSGSSAGSISNSGMISGRNGAVWIAGSTVGSVTNNAGGTLSSTGQTGLRITNASTVTGNVTNNGTILGINTGVYISNGSNVGGNITNSGMIAADWAGLSITNATIAGGITNSAGGTIEGVAANAWSSGHGINFSTSTVGSISNSGTIRGVAGSVAQPGIGIRVANTATVTGAITNNAGGTISGGKTGLLIDATSIVGSISNAGTITGGTGPAINILGTVTSGITNTGTINGAVALNGATLNLNGTAGSITSAVTGGAGSTVSVNGTFTTANTFAVSNFSIASGGLLNMGHGTTSATAFTNAGTLAVAPGITATITGDYTQAAAGTFKTDVTNDTTYGKLIVTGTATVPTNAKITVNVANPSFTFTATSMAGIISAGTLTSDGTFVVTDNSTLFNFTASKNANAVDLALTAAQAAVVAAVTSTAIATTGNTSGLGAATVLDSLAVAFAGGGTGNADMDTVMGALGALTTNQQLSDAVLQTVPQLSGSITQASSASAHSANQAVQGHMEESGGLSSGDTFVTNRNGWIKPLGSWSDQKDRNGAFGYGAQTYGVALGADGELSKAYRIGAAFAYTNSNVDSSSGAQTARVNSYQVILYGSSNLNESTEFNWQADYGYNQNKGNRYIAFMNRNALADYTSNSAHLGVSAGHRMAMNEQTSFTPSIRADYTSIHDNGYTETGAGALNLVVNGKTTDELILAVDGKVAHAVSDTASVTANVGVGYDTQAKQSSITASFAGGGAAFTTTGINPPSTLVRGGLGYVMNTSNAMQITARYDIEARTGFTGQTASVKLKMPF